MSSDSTGQKKNNHSCHARRAQSSRHSGKSVISVSDQKYCFSLLPKKRLGPKVEELRKRIEELDEPALAALRTAALHTFLMDHWMHLPVQSTYAGAALFFLC